MIYNNLTFTMLSVLSVLLFAVMSNANVIHSQQVPTNTTQVPPPSSSSIHRLHAVKITSPTRGQQVPIANNNLTISGTSIANVTSHCQISVLVNDVWPYQPATGTGLGGPGDYSKWNFVLSSKYATIKQGPNNKITAKYTCSNNPTAVSFYSVNVTGRATLTSVAGSHTINPSTTATATVSKQKERPVVARGNNSVGVDSTIASTSSALHSTKLVYLGISKLPSLSHNHGNTAIDQGSSTPTSTISTKSEFSPNVFPFGP